MIILAIVTDLPEIAIAISAAWMHQFDVVLGNLLGGIAIQTLVVAVLDALDKSEPLTHKAGSLIVALEGTLTVAVVTVSLLGIQLPKEMSIAGISPADLLIVITWLGGIWMLNRARKGLSWKLADTNTDVLDDKQGQNKDEQNGGKGDEAQQGKDKPPATQQQGSKEGSKQDDEQGEGDSKDKQDEDKQEGDEQDKPDMKRTWIVFISAAIATLAAGAILEMSGSAAADQIGMSGVVCGATILAAVTALPELSTGYEAVKLHNYEMAMSDVIGSNAFLVVLFFPASLIAGQPILAQGQRADLYLSALGVLVTIIYVWGLIVRSKKKVLRVGIDSLLVIIIYILGVIGLIFLPQR